MAHSTRSIAAALLVLACFSGLIACHSVPDEDSTETPTPMAEVPPVCCPAQSDDWPQYRGLARDGTSPDADMDPWPADGPEELWRRPIGEGFSSIAVKGDDLYTTALDGSEEVLLCLDAATGEEKWRHALGPAFREEYGNGPRSTPTVDDRGMVYALSSYARLDAVDGRTGKTIWSLDLLKRFGTGDVDRGYSSSPLVEGELVVLNVGPGKGGAVVAIDRTLGKVAWAVEDGGAAYSSPLAATLGGKRQIVTAIGRGVVGLDPADGRRLWEHEWSTRYGLNIAMPLVLSDDRVFLSSGYDQGAVMLQVASTEDGWRVTPLWTQRLFRNHFSSSVAHEGVIFGFDNENLKGLDAETGQVLWTQRAYGKGTLIRVGHDLVVLSAAGKLVRIPATAEDPGPVARIDVLSGKCWTAPSMAASRLFLRNGSEMVALAVDGRSARSV